MSNLGLRIVHTQAHYSASRFHEDGVDLNVSHAEFAELMDAVRHDGWVDCLELLENNSEIDLDDVEHYTEVSPYRKQEEA